MSEICQCRASFLSAQLGDAGFVAGTWTWPESALRTRLRASARFPPASGRSPFRCRIRSLDGHRRISASPPSSPALANEFPSSPVVAGDDTTTVKRAVGWGRGRLLARTHKGKMAASEMTLRNLAKEITQPPPLVCQRRDLKI